LWKEKGILTEMDTYDGIVFLPMAEGSGAYHRYFGRLSSSKAKIRGVMDRHRDTPQYVSKMRQELFELLADNIPAVGGSACGKAAGPGDSQKVPEGCRMQT